MTELNILKKKKLNIVTNCCNKTEYRWVILSLCAFVDLWNWKCGLWSNVCYEPPPVCCPRSGIILSAEGLEAELLGSLG